MDHKIRCAECTSCIDIEKESSYTRPVKKSSIKNRINGKQIAKLRLKPTSLQVSRIERSFAMLVTCC